MYSCRLLTPCGSSACLSLRQLSASGHFTREPRHARSLAARGAPGPCTVRAAAGAMAAPYDRAAARAAFLAAFAARANPPRQAARLSWLDQPLIPVEKRWEMWELVQVRRARRGRLRRHDP